MTGPLEQRWAQIVGIALIAATSFVVLRPFITPIAWAAILAYASWPLHIRMDRLLGGRTGLSALAMTVLMVLVVVVPAVLVSAALLLELQSAAEALKAWLPSGPASLAKTLREVPLVGSRFAELIQSLAADPAQMQAWVLARTGLVVGLVASTAGDLGRLALDAILTLLTLFYFFRHGGELVPLLHGAARRLAGGGVDTAVHTLGETVRAVMYGTLSTALTQALLLTLGVWIVGLPSPVCWAR
jgi:predicted PurR-regulated permease PerM